MCGILGAIGRDFDPRWGRAALDLLAHRGPDGSGEHHDPLRNVWLGHRRLSIIDLSDAGRQPMTNEDGTLVLVFNGEIYNYRELREGLIERGHVFRSHCDAEVVLHLYEEKGAELLRDLRGMFAFGLYDGSRGKLLLARDRLGIKPLFYYHDPRLFCFASELKAIRALPSLDLEPDVTAYYDYLTYRFVPAPKTIYKRAAKLPAAHYLEFDGRDLRSAPYWDVDFTNDGSWGRDRALARLEELLEEVVREHLVSDVEIGVFLSAGVDSPLVSALARRISGRAPPAFTIAFPERENDEAEGAARVARLLGSEHDVQRFSLEEVQSRAGLLFELFDEPFADHSALPMIDLSARAARRVKVVLSGDGGDETHAGYGRYAKGPGRDRLLDLLGGIAPGSAPLAALRFPWMRDALEEPRGRRHGFHAGFPRQAKRLILRTNRELEDYDDYWLLREHDRPGFTPLARKQYVDLKTLLPEGILAKVDRTAMHSGLEVRPPLLDHRMIEFAAALPDGLRQRDGQGKPLLRALLERVLPGHDASARKTGFSIPLKHFVSDRGLFRLENDLDVFGAFRIERARVERVLSPRRNALELWMLFVLQAFLARQGELDLASA